jgi:transposase-like protein
MPKINLMNDSSTFAETEVNSTTVGSLRSELDLGSAVINVDRVVATDDHAIVDDANVAVVSRDKKGGAKPAGMRKRRKNSRKRIDPIMKNNILLDIEDGMSIRTAAKTYGVGMSTIHRWRAEGKAHTKRRTTTSTLSSTKVNNKGMLVKPVVTKSQTPQVKEISIHLSGTHVPQKGQLRVTRELLNYLNEVGAHLTK